MKALKNLLFPHSLPEKEKEVIIKKKPKLKGNLHMFPEEIQIIIFSFVWPLCIECLQYELEFLSNRCYLCYMTSTRKTIYDLHMKFLGQENLPKYLPSDTYTYISEPEIGYSCRIKRVNSTNHRNVQCNYVYFNLGNHAEETFRDDSILVYHSFAVNINPDDINYVYFEVGGQTFDRIYGDIFDALYDLYDIPRVNDNGYTIIPFHMSKLGIELVKYHEIHIKIVIKPYRKCPLNNVNIQYSKQYAIGKHDELKEMLTYQIQNTGCRSEDEIVSDKGYYRANFVHPLLYILIEDDEETLELTINAYYPFTLKRIKKYKHVSLFQLAEHLRDFDHTINFSKVDNFRLKTNAKNVYSVTSQVVTCMMGMAGIRFSR